MTISEFLKDASNKEKFDRIVDEETKAIEKEIEDDKRLCKQSGIKYYGFRRRDVRALAEERVKEWMIQGNKHLHLRFNIDVFSVDLRDILNFLNKYRCIFVWATITGYVHCIKADDEREIS